MSNTQEKKTEMYTAQELVWATQLAYCNFDMAIVDKYYQDNGDYPTVQELVAQRGCNIFYNYKEDENPTGNSKTMRDETIKFIKDVMEGNICKGWKIVSVKDNQHESGMYAITIETRENDAIVAFRGSESVSVEQFIKDWVVADFNILNNRMTTQEEDACLYIDEVGNSFGYANFAVTGHSLGGDLALVSTVYTATEECGSDMASRINDKYASVRRHRYIFTWHYAGRSGKPLTRGFCQQGLPKSTGSCLHSIQPRKNISVSPDGDHITSKYSSAKNLKIQPIFLWKKFFRENMD